MLHFAHCAPIISVVPAHISNTKAPFHDLALTLVLSHFLLTPRPMKHLKAVLLGKIKVSHSL